MREHIAELQLTPRLLPGVEVVLAWPATAIMNDERMDAADTAVAAPTSSTKRAIAFISLRHHAHRHRSTTEAAHAQARCTQEGRAPQREPQKRTQRQNGDHQNCHDYSTTSRR
jgi:hypothetical protein